MKITNKHGLPQTFVNYLERRPYSKGDARVSVTELCAAPQLSLLKRRHAKEMEVDAMDSLWSLFGTAVHDVLATGADHQHLTEEDLYCTINGWKVKGGVDLQKINDNDVIVEDYKVTKAFPVMMAINEGKSDWETQLNCYAHLIRLVKGFNVVGLRIWAIIKDHDRNRAEREDSYPDQPMVPIDIPLWTHEEAQQFMEERVDIHRDAWALDQLDADLPECTDEERWKRPDSWAVYRNRTNKRASAVKDTEEEAKEWLASVVKKSDDPVIEHRRGRYIRCEDFCEVRYWCRQWERENGHD